MQWVLLGPDGSNQNLHFYAKQIEDPLHYITINYIKTQIVLGWVHVFPKSQLMTMGWSFPLQL